MIEQGDSPEYMTFDCHLCQVPVLKQRQMRTAGLRSRQMDRSSDLVDEEIIDAVSAFARRKERMQSGIVAFSPS